jgi:type IV pilus assembly protein PilV
MTNWVIDGRTAAQWEQPAKAGHPAASSLHPAEAPGPTPVAARQRGFGLLETLIAAVVLAIGLLGLASLYAVSLKSADSAQLRTRATLLAEDILERMRANREQAMEGEYDTADLEEIPDGDCADGEDVVACDLKSWRNLITASKGFSNPIDSSIDCGPDICVVTISFDDTRGEIGAAPAADGEAAPLELIYRTRL